MFKNFLIGLAAGAGVVAVGYLGLIAYTTRAISKSLDLNFREEDEADELGLREQFDGAKEA